jgi:hypothetical protein
MSESWTMAGIGGGTIIPLADLGILAVGMVCIIFIAKGIDRVLMVLALFLVMVIVCLKANAASPVAVQGFYRRAIAAEVTAEVTTNEVLFVDQRGNVSRPETLATTADMAANKAALITAEEKATAAEAAAKAGTNLVSGIIADIGRNELVVYREGYTDGFSAAVVLDPDAKLLTTEFEILDETSGDLAAFYLKYALKNSQAADVQPIVKWRSALASGIDYEPLPSTQVEPFRRLNETYTDTNGVVYPYVYEVKCFAPAREQGFFVVVLMPDDAAGDGATFELPNGVTGGLTARIPFGNFTLVIEGGICVGVENSK